MNSKTIVCFIFSIRIHAHNRESPPAISGCSRNSHKYTQILLKICGANLRENLEECKDVDELFLLHTKTNFCGGEIEAKRKYFLIHCMPLQDNIHCKSKFFMLQFLF